VNCVDYFSGGDRPYLLSGADDNLAKVWDYQTKACVQVRPTGNMVLAAFSFQFAKALVP
jgi:coatomer subunit beta'